MANTHDTMQGLRPHVVEIPDQSVSRPCRPRIPHGPGPCMPLLDCHHGVVVCVGTDCACGCRSLYPLRSGTLYCAYAAAFLEARSLVATAMAARRREPSLAPDMYKARRQTITKEEARKKYPPGEVLQQRYNDHTPYPWCLGHPLYGKAYCIELGYCPRNPSCGD